MKDSKISWTNHTFNGLRGCAKVSAGCDHCYAESMSHRNPKTLGVWGEEGTRVLASESMWAQPLLWNREAEKAGVRARVFSYSLGDVFERPMKPENLAVCETARAQLFALIERTPWLDWLLLTKRPENIMGMIQEPWRAELPSNVWVGTSVENQAAANERIPHLLKIPARVRFLSMEPLLEAVAPNLAGVGWVIVGGESGSVARPFDLAWARSIRDQCKSAGVPFFMKQTGAMVHVSARPCTPEEEKHAVRYSRGYIRNSGTVEDYMKPKHPKGGDPSEWPADLRLQEFPR